jgi:transposase InsO family protein
MVSVIYKKRALPIAWIVIQGTKGHFPEETHIHLSLQLVQRLWRKVGFVRPDHCACYRIYDYTDEIGRVTQGLKNGTVQQWQQVHPFARAVTERQPQRVWPADFGLKDVQNHHLSPLNQAAGCAAMAVPLAPTPSWPATRSDI